MIFSVGISLTNLRHSDDKNRGSQPKVYAMQVSDTVLVGAPGKKAEVLTDVPKKWKDISYVLNEEEEEEGGPDGKENRSGRSTSASVKVENMVSGKRSSALRRACGERGACLSTWAFFCETTLQ